MRSCLAGSNRNPRSVLFLHVADNVAVSGGSNLQDVDLPLTKGFVRCVNLHGVGFANAMEKAATRERAHFPSTCCRISSFSWVLANWTNFLMDAATFDIMVISASSGA